MSHQNTPAERQLLRFILDLPLPEVQQSGWIDQIHATGMSAELGDEIRKALVDDQAINQATRARYEVDLARRISQWRMENGAKSFRKSS
jgi:hypothetical protein